MPTNEERREIAQRLRECRDIRKLFEALGFPWDVESDWTWSDVKERLADLIESSGHECVPGECPLNVRHDNDRIDRERLLAIATLMAADSVRSVKQGTDVSPVYILHAARNIAEACGETFGSIRNRELAKWGTSIVPKETIVDCDALLELADEFDAMAKVALPQEWSNPTLASMCHDLADEYAAYARRIREACGVER